MVTIMFTSMVVLLVFAFPMMTSVIIGPIAVLYIYYDAISPDMLVQQMVSGVRLMSLIAIPLFIFSAGIMTKGTTADRLIKLALALIQHRKGGLGIATAWACTVFGAISGSSQATVVAMGQTLLPRLVSLGYSSSFSLALIISSANIALLIPPSMAFIIYGVVTGSSVGKLFIAGIMPGIILAIFFSIYTFINAWIAGVPTQDRLTWKDRSKALRDALPALGFPILIIGGIYSGLTSPNEAAGISLLYAVVLEMLVYRTINLKDIYDVALETGVVTTVVFILIAAGAAFSWLITFAQVPDQIMPILFGENPSTVYTLYVITAIYFVACMFIDSVVAIMVITPIIFPLAKSVGIDPIVLGAIVTTQAALGGITPPFGCNIFTAVAVFRRPYLEVVRNLPIFIILTMLMSVLLIHFPEIPLFLTRFGG